MKVFRVLVWANKDLSGTVCAGLDLARQDSFSHATMAFDGDGYGSIPVYGPGPVLPSDGTPKVRFQSTSHHLIVWPLKRTYGCWMRLDSNWWLSPYRPLR